MTSLDLDGLHKQLDWYSTAVSSSVRSTAFGVIAAMWALFTATGISLTEHGLFGVPTQFSVRMAFVFASGALLADISQYVSAYWMTNIGVDKLAENLQKTPPKPDFYYNKECLGGFAYFLYIISFWLFPLKLSLAIASAVSFVFLAFGVTIN